MSAAGQIELNELLARVRKVNPKAVHDVKTEVEKYFGELGFSVLKAAWDRLTAGQRDAFIGPCRSGGGTTA